MTIERIELILKSYKEMLGRCNHLKTEMNMIERQIKVLKRDTAETLAAPKPRQLTDMPRGTQISNPTEKYGGMLADGYKTDEQVALETKLGELTAEYNEKIVFVEYVNSWLTGLTDREQTIIKANMIEDMSWRDTANVYKGKYGDDVSKDTLKRIKDKAMEKIYKIAM